MKIFLRYWLPLGAHMGLIIFLSAQTGDKIQVPDWFFYADKVAHMGLFGALCFFFLRAWVRGRWFQTNAKVFLLAIVFTTVYGITDEIHQIYVPDRFPSLGDIAADCTGAVVVCGLFYLLQKWGWSEVREHGEDEKSMDS